MYNHAACNIHDPHSVSGILEGNPVHEDMLFAAKASGIRFILNVILNQNKEIIGAVAGDIDTAHKAGRCLFIFYVPPQTSFFRYCNHFQRRLSS